MEQRARLQSRIENLKELRELVRMMRGLAATHLHEAREALAGIRSYVDIIEDSIASGASLIEGRPPEPPTAIAEGDHVLIIVASEHGFAGAFNDRLIAQAKEVAKPGQQTGIIGRRGAMLARESGVAVDWSFPMATHVGGVLGVTRRVADHLAGVIAADIVFARYTGGGAFNIETNRILPLDPALLEKSGRRQAPLHHLPPMVLLERLASEYLFAEISRAVMESMASENGVRLRVMDSANNTIDDKVEKLTRQEQTLRQDEITTELLDVVTGAEAVFGNDE